MRPNFIPRLCHRPPRHDFRPAFCCGALLVALPAGYAWDRIQMPFNAGFLFGSNNASLLVVAFNSPCAIPSTNCVFSPRASGKIFRHQIDQPSARRQIADLVDLYRKWAKPPALNIAMSYPRTERLLWSSSVLKMLFEQTTLTMISCYPHMRKHLATSLDQMPYGLAHNDYEPNRTIRDRPALRAAETISVRTRSTLPARSLSIAWCRSIMTSTWAPQ